MQRTKHHRGQELYSFHWPLSGASASHAALSASGRVTAAVSAVTLSFPGTGVSAGPSPPHFCFHQSTHGQVMCRLSRGAPGWLDALLSLRAISLVLSKSHCCKVCRTPSGDTVPDLTVPDTHFSLFDPLNYF